MPLRLVPPSPLLPADKLRRVLHETRQDGMLQCNRCGCRSAVTVVQGARVHKGRVQGGTVTARHACEECFKRGEIVPLLPELTPIR